MTDAAPDEYTKFEGPVRGAPWYLPAGDDKYRLIHDYVWTEDDE